MYTSLKLPKKQFVCFLCSIDVSKKLRFETAGNNRSLRKTAYDVNIKCKKLWLMYIQLLIARPSAVKLRLSALMHL